MWLAVLLGLASRAVGDEFEYALYNRLMMGYNPLERPVPNNSDPVKVTLGIVLQQIVDVDEKNQIIKLNAWLSYTWKDYKLNWDPKDYGGVSDVRFPFGTIWKPDVLLYNSVDSNFDSTYPSNMVVYSDGTINWIPPGIFAIACKIDITWFPFDDQNCFFKFGSWTYNGFQLDLRPADENGLDTTEYIQNGEWALLSTPVNRSEKFYDCCPEPYLDLKFYMRMRRRTLYYGFNLIIPLWLGALLISLMTVLGFTLPPDAGEKITLGTSLVPMSIPMGVGLRNHDPPLRLLLPLHGRRHDSSHFRFLPHPDNPVLECDLVSEAVPLVGAFFSCCMMVVSASVVTTVLVLNLHYRTADMYEMSHWTRSILLNWLPWMLLMKRPGHYFSRKSLPNPFSAKEKSSGVEETESESLLRNIRSIEDGPDGDAKIDVVTIYNLILMSAPHGGLKVVHESHSLDLEYRISQCLKALAAGSHPLDPGQQALLLMLQRIYSELKVPSLLDLEYRISQCLKALAAGSHPLDPGQQALLLMLQRIYSELKVPSLLDLEYRISQCLRALAAGSHPLDTGQQALLLMLQSRHFITKRMEAEDESSDAENDWKFAAMVVDRLCLIVFSIFIITSSCGILFSAPYLVA